MAPNEYSIFDINSAFGVDEDFDSRTPSLPASSANWTVLPTTPENMQRILNTLSPDPFEVAEAPTNRSSSSTEAGMPQFYEDSATSDETQYQKALSPFKGNPNRPTPNPWNPIMVRDLALGVDSTSEILERYELTDEDYAHLCEVPAFRRDLSVMMRDLREKGSTFAVRAAIQAESYLLDIDNMIHDPAVPSSTKLAAMQSMVKWGGLEPKEVKTADVASGTQVTLNITFANNAQVANIGGH